MGDVNLNFLKYNENSNAEDYLDKFNSYNSPLPAPPSSQNQQDLETILITSIQMPPFKTLSLVLF